MNTARESVGKEAPVFRSTGSKARAFRAGKLTKRKSENFFPNSDEGAKIAKEIGSERRENAREGRRAAIAFIPHSPFACLSRTRSVSCILVAVSAAVGVR